MYPGPIESVKHVVWDLVKKARPELNFTTDDVIIVWFSYILGGWKAYAFTNLEDARTYEVTYNVNKEEIYINTLLRIENTVTVDPFAPVPEEAPLSDIPDRLPPVIGVGLHIGG